MMRKRSSKFNLAYIAALSALDSLERRTREAGDTEVLKRVVDRLLTLSGRMPMEPKRLVELYSLVNGDKAPEAICGTAALRVAEAFGRKRNFDKAREWLDKVPDVSLSTHGRQVILNRWQTMEEALNKGKTGAK